MQTPSKISLASFAAERDAWIKANCITRGEFQHCRTCDAKIEIVGVYFSMHDARMTGMCSGFGRVMRLVVPFCPTCESRPHEYSCLHDFPLSKPGAIFN